VGPDLGPRLEPPNTCGVGAARAPTSSPLQGAQFTVAAPARPEWAAFQPDAGGGTALSTRPGRCQMPALAERTAIGFASPLFSAQEGGIERVAFGRVPPLAGAHPILFFACGFLGHAGVMGCLCSALRGVNRAFSAREERGRSSPRGKILGGPVWVGKAPPSWFGWRSDAGEARFGENKPRTNPFAPPPRALHGPTKADHWRPNRLA